jgi:hypothetical protein
MKMYRVELNMGGHTLIQADHVLEDASRMQFLREGAVIAQYPCARVKMCHEVHIDPAEVKPSLRTTRR